MKKERHSRGKAQRHGGTEQSAPQLSGPVGLGALEDGLPEQEWTAVLAWLPLRAELQTHYVHGCEDYSRLTLTPGPGGKAPSALTLKIEAKDNNIPPEAEEEVKGLRRAFGITSSTSPRTAGVGVFSSSAGAKVSYLILTVKMSQDLTAGQMRLFAEAANRIYGILNPKPK